MTGANHMLLGAAAAIVLERLTGFVQPHLDLDLLSGVAPFQDMGRWANYGLVFGVAMLASLLPDIDAQHSLIRQRTYTARGILGRGAGKLFRILFGAHRTRTHWLLSWLILSVVGLTLTWLFAPAWIDLVLASSIGYVTHLLADMMTINGVPIFGPFDTRKHHLLPTWLRFRSGSLWEKLWVFLLMALALGVWLI